MQKYDIHVCLISAQAAPNLLPILDDNFKPKEAIFLVSKKMKSNAEYLSNAFKKLNIKVTIQELTNEFNFGLMENEIFSLVEKYYEENIALNVTGGTKLMSIAAENAFTAAGKPIFYVDTDHNRILFISKDESKQWLPSLEMKSKNKIDIYLLSYGSTVLKIQKPKEREKYLQAVEPFIRNYNNYVNLLPMLNMHATLSQSNGYKSEFTKSNPKIKSIDELFFGLDYQGLIDYDGVTVNFKNKEIKNFLNGGWLEDYTYFELASISAIEDLACGVDVANPKYKLNKDGYSPENKGNKNEFDIVFMAKNKLHIIECKTQKMDKEGGIKADDILYKLETLKDYGGLMTKKCLVSYFEVPEQVKNRANFLNIEIIQGKDLQRLKSKIQEWIGKK
ncbi:Card1-like endonuclease domain-containing protein [Ursidibacter sp. B-7004-1]